MKAKHYSSVTAEKVNTSGAENVDIRWLIGESEEKANFFMRVLEIKEDGNTPYHSHDWEHEIFVLDGNGVLKLEGQEIALEKGSFAFIGKDKMHQFINKTEHIFRFICLIPRK